MQRLAQFYIDIPALRPGTRRAYAFAFLSAGVATALPDCYRSVCCGRAGFVRFLAAVTGTTLIGGFGAGVFCTVLSTAVAHFW